MALKKVGSRLVAEGASQYTSQMGQAAAATRQVGEAGREAGSGVDGLNFRSLTLASTLGSLLASAIQKVLGGLANLGKQALNEVASFERLTFSMESLVARELRAFDSTLSMADALEQAGPAAQGLLHWIQQLAIQSPFGVEDVAQAFKTAQAYGFTAQEAMNLTQVMIDFASATGATGDVMGRAALALGQIQAKGKLAGQEILQLVNAGINVNSILQKMGFTLEDVSAGVVSADAFLKAFTETMESDFGGAAKRSMGTLSGLMNTLSDLRSMALRSFFTPIFQEVQPYLAAFASKLQELLPVISYFGQLVGSATRFLIENREAILKAVLAIGAAVAAFFLIINAGTIFTAVSAGVTAALGAVAAAVTFLLSPIGILATAVAGLAALFIFSFQDIQFSADSFFSDFSGNMFSFGHDLVMAFAEGMATAINAVLDVLIQIGNIIATWLAPGSPPKLLPNIDTWGTEAMNEYFRGFLNADFGIFNQLSGMISRFIRSLDIPETDVIPRILGARGAIAEAVSQLQKTGNITTAAIQKIMGAIGSNNPALEGYIQALIRVTAASQDVAEAQEAVTAAQQVVAAAQERVRAATEAVRQAQERLNSVSEKYANILKPMNAEMEAIHRRRQEVIDQQREAELQAILSDENAPALAKELALMELREIELARQIQATEDQRDAALETEQANVDRARAAEEAAQQEVQSAQDALAAQQELLRAQQDALAVQQEALAAQEAMIQAQTENNELIKQQIALLERLNRQTAAGAGERAKVGGAGKPTLPSLPRIPTDFGALAGIESPFDSIIEGWKDKIDGLLGEITGKFDKVGRKLKELQKTWGTVFTNIINLPIWFEIRYKIKEIRRLIEDIINPLLEGDWGTAWENAQTAVSGVNFTDVLAALGGLALAIVGGPGVIPAVGLLGVAWTQNWGGIRDKVTEVWEGVVQPALASLQVWLQENIPVALQTLSDFWTNTLLPAIQNVWTWVSGTLVPFITGTLVPTIQTILTTALQILSKFWEEILLPAIKIVWGFIQNDLVPLFQALDKLLRVTVTLALTVLQGAWENILLPALKSVWGFIQNSLQPIFKTVWGFIQDNLIPIVKDLADKIGKGSLLNTAFKSWKTIVDALKTGLDNISTAIQTVIGWIGDLITAIGNIEIPEILTPGSPTPFELGLRGIASALQDINKLLPETDRRLGRVGNRSISVAQGLSNYAMPVTSASLANSGGSTVYNQNRVTVGENINVADKLDLNMLINALQQVMNNQFPSTL